MYRVYVKYGGTDFPLLHPLEPELQISGAVLTETAGKAGSFRFEIAAVHPFYSKIQLMKSYITVFRSDSESEDEAWHGRVISIDSDFYNTLSVTCEGELAYLNDSILPVYGFTGGINGYLDYVLQIHNSQVDSEKQISRGVIEVTNSTDYIYRANSDYPTLLRELEQKLVKSYGGYFRIRRSGGMRYLDYLMTYGQANTQEIRPETNLLDVSGAVTADDFCTRLIPLGSKQSSSSGNIPLTVESVNGGKLWVDNTALIQRYGIIVATKSWEDVTVPANLLSRGQAAVNAMELPKSFTLNAVDLSLLDSDIDTIRLGCNIPVVSPFHGLEAEYFITKRVRYLDQPEKDTISFGEAVKNYTARVISNRAELIYSIVQQIVDTARTITGAKTGYVVLDTYNDKGELVQPWRILIMDNPNKDAAKYVIQLNNNGIGFSSTGVNGTYAQSWDMEGNLTLGGVNDSYGKFHILDENGNEILLIDKTGLYLKDAAGTLLAKMSVDGLGVYTGTIDFNWGTDTGFYADGTKVQIGDFICDSSFGRSIFQSDSRLGRTTGMSAETEDENLLYFWAGYQDEDDYVFLVNGGDAYVMYNGQAYPIGASIANLNYAVSAYIRDIESGDDDDGDEEGDGEDYGGGYLEDGNVINDLSQEGGE